jgi:hypothetical protein
MMPCRDTRHVWETRQGRRGDPLGGFAVCVADQRRHFFGRKKSGNFAMLAAIREASSNVTGLADDGAN